MTSAQAAALRPIETVELAGGERVPIHDELRRAVAEALPWAASKPDGETALETFVELLTGSMHRKGIILVPRARSNTREAVDADLYSLALSAKYAADQALFAVRLVVDVLPGRGSLLAEFEAVIEQLTSHASPIGMLDRLALLEDRLRRLRLVVLGTAIDAPLADPGEPLAAAGAGDAAPVLSGAEG
jgi:hypothetical protein